MTTGRAATAPRDVRAAYAALYVACTADRARRGQRAGVARLALAPPLLSARRMLSLLRSPILAALAALTLTACVDTARDPDGASVLVPSEVALGAGDCGGAAAGTLDLVNDGATDLHVALDSLDPRLAVAPARAVIAPGETLAVQVTAAVPLHAAAGEVFTAPVRVVTDADDGKAYLVPVSFEARGATIAIDPPSIGFGDVPVGLQGARPFTVRNTGNAPAKVAIRGGGHGELAIDLPVTELAPGASISGEATYLPLDAGDDVRSAAVTVSGATCGATPWEVVASGAGVIGGELLVQGGPVDFGDVTCDGAVPLRTLTLVNPTGAAAPFTASIVHTDGGANFTVSPDGGVVPASGSLVLSVKRRDVVAPAAAGERSALVRIETPFAATPVREIAVHQTLVAPQLRLSTATDFGAVTIGRTASLPVSLTNTGNQAARVTIESSHRDFHADLPTWLEPGATVDGHVHFTPSTRDPAAAKITLTADAACTPPTVTIYTGSGE